MFVLLFIAGAAGAAGATGAMANDKNIMMLNEQTAFDLNMEKLYQAKWSCFHRIDVFS